QKGFSTNWVDHQLWHVFTDIDPETGFRIDVAERSDFREELEGRVTQDSIFIMLITYPFLGILIWIIVGRGLDSIRQVTDEIKQRAPSYLEPVNLEVVPTEIQPLVDELNQLFTRLYEAFEREKRFASDAAHELKTPLAALKAQTQVALKIKDPEELKLALQKIITGVDRSSHVVHQLLTMSRMAPDATLQNEEKVDLNAIITEVLVDIAPRAIEKGTDVELHAPEGELFIMGYPTALGILARNLIDNAIRYTPSGSLVKVSLQKLPDATVLEVSDNGPGIPKELRERVFERFYRVLGTKETGSGLGLGIVQQIVTIHHAKLQLSEPAKGTGLIVTVRFPQSSEL
ncbi:MAG: two-component sensor histidine kinase, partial [Coxiellaceae bacterium]|nr:two-component sensor histidine kinase [Coxiellaceae bacterium]